MEIKIKNNFYFIDKIEITLTYGGLIIGNVNDALNNKIINNITHQWRGLKCHVIKPDKNLNALPKYECYAIIFSNKLVNDSEAFGSQCFVKFYSDFNSDLKNELMRVISKVNWEEIGEDYYI